MNYYKLLQSINGAISNVRNPPVKLRITAFKARSAMRRIDARNDRQRSANAALALVAKVGGFKSLAA